MTLRFFSAILFFTITAHAHGQLLVANNGNDEDLPQAWNVDLNDGSATALWQTSAGIEVWGMAFDPASQSILASSGPRLYSGGLGETPTLLGTMTDGAGASLTMPGLAWANGGLYAVRGVGDEAIFSVDLDTLVATVVLDFPELEYDFGGLAFNPDNNLFYGTSDSLAADGVGLYSIDVFGSGNISLVTSYPSGEFDIDGLAIGNGVAYLVQDSSGDTIHPYDLTTNTYLANLQNPMPTSEVFSAAAFVSGMDSPDGDFDNDGDYDCADINSLVSEIAAGSSNTAFDLTADGILDLDDRDAWLAEAGADANSGTSNGNPFLLGDANLDGFVDTTDFNVWNENKFTMNPAWCSGDFNADGFIDTGDFNIWNENKFTSSDVSAVPEPSGAALLLLGLLSLSARRFPRSRSRQTSGSFSGRLNSGESSYNTSIR